MPFTSTGQSPNYSFYTQKRTNFVEGFIFSSKVACQLFKPVALFQADIRLSIINLFPTTVTTITTKRQTTQNNVRKKAPLNKCSTLDTDY